MRGFAVLQCVATGFDVVDREVGVAVLVCVVECVVECECGGFVKVFSDDLYLVAVLEDDTVGYRVAPTSLKVQSTEAGECRFARQGDRGFIASGEEVVGLLTALWHNDDMIAQLDDCVGAFAVKVNGCRRHEGHRLGSFIHIYILPVSILNYKTFRLFWLSCPGCDRSSLVTVPLKREALRLIVEFDDLVEKLTFRRCETEAFVDRLRDAAIAITSPVDELDIKGFRLRVKAACVHVGRLH